MSMPELRFNEFKEDWNSESLGKLIQEFRLGGDYSNSETKTNYPLIKMGNLDRGSIKLDKIEYIEDSEKVDPKDKIVFGDLFFNTRNTLELVGKVAIWKNELPCAYYNSNLMLMRFNNNFFMNYRLNSPVVLKKLRALATGTTSVAAIYNKDLFQIKTQIPSLPEQTKIANFLTAVDEKITQLTQKHDLLNQYKKGVIQQIFSQELRFKDDDGEDFPDWRETQLGSIATFTKGKGISKADIDSNGITFCIRYGELYTEYGETISAVKSKTNVSVKNLVLSEVNDVIIPASGETQIDIATASCVQVSGVALGGDLNIIKSHENGVFLSYYLNNPKKIEIAKLAQGNSVVHLYSSQLKLLDINLPSKAEQTKIANFLTAIDDKITVTQTQLQAAKQYKQGLLQQMFI